MSETATLAPVKHHPLHIHGSLEAAQSEVARIKAEAEQSGKPYKQRLIFQSKWNDTDYFIIGQSYGRAAGHMAGVAGLKLAQVDPPAKPRGPGRTVTVEGVMAKLPEMSVEDMARVEAILARLKEMRTKPTGSSSTSAATAPVTNGSAKATEPAKAPAAASHGKPHGRK